MTRSIINRYLEKSVHYPILLDKAVSPDLNMIVVIPCFNEENLLTTLSSLLKCSLPKSGVEVLVVINDGEQVTNAIRNHNDQTYQEMIAWAEKNNSTQLSFHAIRITNMPRKFAGVGLARKIGMDEAVRRFSSIDNKNGIIVCLDADSQVESNYLSTISAHFLSIPETKACAIHYEHPLTGDFNQNIYESISQYELHLRYFIEQQKKINLPFAYQTVGSSMAVRLEAYCSVGGMNRRKAGEDFYFFHKFVKLGKVTELYSTKVIPSPRISDRVPFGTGKAVGDMMDKPIFLTYHPQSFSELQPFLDRIKTSYFSGSILELKGLHKQLICFFEGVNVYKKWEEIEKNTKDWNSFHKRFFHWFDAFLFMKYLHHMRDGAFSNLPILEAVRMSYPEIEEDEIIEYLNVFRNFR